MTKFHQDIDRTRDGDLTTDELLELPWKGPPYSVGREWLAEQVCELLDDPDCRFVVLTGGPGVGKTAFMAYPATTHLALPSAGRKCTSVRKSAGNGEESLVRVLPLSVIPLANPHLCGMLALARLMSLCSGGGLLPL